MAWNICRRFSISMAANRIRFAFNRQTTKLLMCGVRMPCIRFNSFACIARSLIVILSTFFQSKHTHIIPESVRSSGGPGSTALRSAHSTTHECKSHIYRHDLIEASRDKRKRVFLSDFMWWDKQYPVSSVERRDAMCVIIRMRLGTIHFDLHRPYCSSASLQQYAKSYRISCL